MAVTNHQPHRVFLKSHWEDEWVLQSDDGLYCDWCKFACSPDVNEAQLSRNFGPAIFRANSSIKVNGPPLDIEGQYVKVVIALDALGTFLGATRTWYGVVILTQESRWGRDGDPATPGSIGKQIFQCRGLEYLLQRTYVDTSHVKTATGEDEIGRAIAFNLGSGYGNETQRIGNKSEEVGDNDAYIFSETISDEPYRDGDAALWSAADIATYLLHYHPPKDRTEAQIVPFDIEDGSGFAVLESLFPTQTAHEKSVKQILDELIDRRRIMTWWLEVGDDERPTIRVTTFNKDEIELPSGQTIPANPEQGTWYTDDEGLFVNFDMTKDDSSRFHQVIARGEPLGVCFTISNEDDCLEADWDAGLETDYKAGASAAAGYAALEDWQKDNAHQALRNTDRFQKVYRYFSVPPEWDGQSGGSVVFRDPDSVTGEALPVWLPGLRFKPSLPLLTETDYATAEPETSEMLEGSKPEYRRPFAVIYDERADRYYHTEKMSYGHEIEDGLRTNGRSWSLALRMQDDAFGVVLDASGSYQHIIAKNVFTPVDAFDFYDEEEALEWQDVSCTVFCEYDGFSQAKYPTQVTSDDDAINILRLHVANARLDYLAPETIIGVDDEGALQRCTDGGYVRDDREKLKDVARSAYEWYTTSRRAINATVRTLVITIELGQLITNTGNVNTQVVANSVVTSLTFNILQNTTTVQTQFAQLDFAAFPGRAF